MKHLLLTTIAAVVLVGCGEAEESSTHLEQPKLSDMRTISMSPLNIAAEKGDLKAVKELLDSGVDIDSLDHTGTPLNHAAGNGHKEIVELLIAKGADVNAKMDAFMGGYTPLHRAANEGHKEIVELLIAKGADVNTKDDEGKPPLNFAKSKKETAELLRKHGGKTGEELKADGK